MKQERVRSVFSSNDTTWGNICHYPKCDIDTSLDIQRKLREISEECEEVYHGEVAWPTFSSPSCSFLGGRQRDVRIVRFQILVLPHKKHLQIHEKSANAMETLLCSYSDFLCIHFSLCQNS